MSSAGFTVEILGLEEIRNSFNSGELMKKLLAGAGTSGTDDGDENPKLTRLRKLRPPSRKKTKYCCPGCQVNVWGRPSLRIRCEDCGELYEEIG